jgi:hypothetical protein
LLQERLVGTLKKWILCVKGFLVRRFAPFLTDGGVAANGIDPDLKDQNAFHAIYEWGYHLHIAEVESLFQKYAKILPPPR